MFTAGGDDSEDPSVATTAVQTSSGTAGSGGPTDWIHVAEGGDRREGLSPHEWGAGTPGMMTVVGLREGADGELSDCNSRDLSMLLRLQGPEALAEVLFKASAANTAATTATADRYHFISITNIVKVFRSCFADTSVIQDRARIEGNPGWRS